MVLKFDTKERDQDNVDNHAFLKLLKVQNFIEKFNISGNTSQKTCNFFVGNFCFLDPYPNSDPLILIMN